MFFKQLKHDLVFGRNMFIALGICIVVSAIAGLIFYQIAEDEETARNVRNMSVFLVMGLVFGFISVHFSQFIEKSMFGDSGYLTLTLPITRGRLLLSKLFACWTWYNFIMLTVLIGMAIVSGTQSPYELTVNILPPISTNMIAYYINIFFVFFSTLSIMFFGLTLHNSVFGKWKVPGFITATLCLGTVIAYCITIIRVVNRHREQVLETATILRDGIPHTYTRMVWHREMGLHVLRLELFDSYIDLLIAAMGLALGLAACLITWYLLKKRVSLQ